MSSTVLLALTVNEVGIISMPNWVEPRKNASLCSNTKGRLFFIWRKNNEDYFKRW